MTTLAPDPPVVQLADGPVTWARDPDDRFDGVWRPRSRAAAEELRVLLPLVSEHMGGPVTRVSLNIVGWDADQPRRLRLADRIVRIGWFRTLDPTTATFGRGTYDRITLQVVPPDAT